MLLSLPNVVGVGLGMKQTKNVATGKICLKVYVEKKIPKDKLSREEIIPEKLEGVKTDVEEIGGVNVQ